MACKCHRCGRFYVPTFPDDLWCSRDCRFDAEAESRRQAERREFIDRLYAKHFPEVPYAR